MTISFHAKTKSGYWIHPYYEVMQFPGGEWFIKDHEQQVVTEEYAFIQAPTADDLVIAALWADIPNIAKRAVLLPYLPAARGDKDTPKGAAIYAAILNTIPVPIRYVHPHSQVMPSLLTKGEEIPIHRLIKETVSNNKNHTSPYMGVIAPDHGAVERAGDVASHLEVDLAYATKKRDPATGKLSQFEAPELAPGRWLVVDDICDGGGTFMGLATAIKEQNEGKEIALDLWVTHGVFSGAAKEKLPQYFWNIYTTDSFPQSGGSSEFKTVSILPTLLGG